MLARDRRGGGRARSSYFWKRKPRSLHRTRGATGRSTSIRCAPWRASRACRRAALSSADEASRGRLFSLVMPEGRRTTGSPVRTTVLMLGTVPPRLREGEQATAPALVRSDFVLDSTKALAGFRSSPRTFRRGVLGAAPDARATNSKKVPVPRCRPRGDSLGRYRLPTEARRLGLDPNLSHFSPRRAPVWTRRTGHQQRKSTFCRTTAQKSHPWDSISSFSEEEIFGASGPSNCEDRITSRSSLRASSRSPLISPLSTSRRSTPAGSGRQM